MSDGEAESTSVYRMTIDIAEVTSAPGRPRNLTVVPGSGAVALNWEAPLSPGSSAIVRYEVRHAAGEAVPAATAWQSVGLNFTHTVTELANGQRHTFEVRAVNGSTPGEGPAAQVQATPSRRPVAARGVHGVAEGVDGDQGHKQDLHGKTEHPAYAVRDGDAVEQQHESDLLARLAHLHDHEPRHQL